MLTKKDAIKERDYIMPKLKIFSQKFPATTFGYYTNFSAHAGASFHMLVYPESVLKNTFFREALIKLDDSIEKKIFSFCAMKQTEVSDSEKIKNAPYQFLNGKLKKKVQDSVIKL